MGGFPQTKVDRKRQVTEVKRGRGRPKGSKNKPKVSSPTTKNGGSVTVTKMQGSVTVLNGGGYEPVLFVGDIHAPFQDNQALWVVEHLMKEFKPKRLVHLGDHFDFYKVSKFARDPGRLDSLQDEIDEGVSVLRRWREILPEAEFSFHLGNHEDRLRKYMWANAPELASLRALDFRSLIEADKLKLKVYEYNEGEYLTSSFMATHGNIIRTASAYTAKGMLEKHGLSGISGHTHRLGAHYRRDRGGFKVWFENGCLCTLQPEYERFPNWQQGFTLGWFKKNGGRFHLEQIVISEHAFIYNGKRYGID